MFRLLRGARQEPVPEAAEDPEEQEGDGNPEEQVEEGEEEGAGGGNATSTRQRTRFVTRVKGFGGRFLRGRQAGAPETAGRGPRSRELRPARGARQREKPGNATPNDLADASAEKANSSSLPDDSEPLVAGEDSAAQEADQGKDAVGQEDVEGQGVDKAGAKMTITLAGEVVSHSAAEERDMFLCIARNSITGRPLPTEARVVAMRKGKFEEEDVGLLREPRPNMFQDVVNAMEQRLTLLEESGNSNLIPAQRAPPRLPPKGEGLEAIHEDEGDDVQEQDNKKQSEEGDETPEGGKEGEEGKEEAEGAKRKNTEPRQKRKRHEADSGDGLREKKFLDISGIMISLPDPEKRYRERPSWQFDPDAPYLDRRVVIPSVEPVHKQSREPQYILDIEISHLEFSAHPLMAREEYLMAQLMSLVRDFKRREMVGLADFYAAKLGALEETLLVAREDMFAAVQRFHNGESRRDTQEAIAELLENCAKFELQVSETRQLKEEEELKLAESAENMAKLYFKIDCLRTQQGYRLTPQRLEMHMIPYNPEAVELQTRKSRDELDAELLASEDEKIAGLPPPPEIFSNIQPLVGGFRLRRVESTCASHMKEVRMLQEELAALMGRDSVTEESEEVQVLRKRLEELGPAPHREPCTESEARKSLRRARESVRRGEYGVPRIDRPLPVLVDEGIRKEDEVPLPEKEESRRQRVERSEYYVKLLMNGNNFAGKSDARCLRSDFALDFCDVLRVKLRRWPEVTLLQLWKKGAVRHTYVADVPFIVPGSAPGSAPEDSTAVQYNWSSRTPFFPKWPPPGSDEDAMSPMKIFIPDSNIFASGGLWVQCRWVAQDEDDGPVFGYTNPLASSPMLEAPVRPLVPPLPHGNSRGDLALQRGALGGVGKISKTRLAEWLGRAGLDPNDPRNAWYLELLKTREAQAAAAGRQVDGYFRLDVAEEVLLKPTKALDGRAKILSCRWDTGLGSTTSGISREFKMTTKEFEDSQSEREERQIGRRFMIVPLDDYKLASEADTMIAELRELDADDKSDTTIPDPVRRMFAASGSAGEPTTKFLREREKAIQAFMLTIRSRFTTRSKANRSGQIIKTEDVVREEVLPEFGLDLSRLLSAFAPVRKFGPVQRKAAPIVNHPKTVLLCVTIMKATNLPERAEIAGGPSRQATTRPSHGRALMDPGSGAYGGGFSARQSRSRRPEDDVDGEGQDDDKVKLMPFVEVGFQARMPWKTHSPQDFMGMNQTSRTASSQAVAGAAIWNDQITIPFHLKNNSEFSPSAMAECRDEIVISLYDKVLEDQKAQKEKVEKAGGEAAEELCIHSERRLLGSLCMSVGAVYRAMEIKGTFALEVPPVIAGYKPLESTTDGKPKLPSLECVVGFAPSLEIQPPTPQEELRSSEADDINRHAFNWLSDILKQSHCRRRYVKAMAVDASGKSTLLCRYVGASWELPDGYDQGDRETIMQRLSRLVAQVPYLQDNDMRRSRHDVWTSCAKSLELGVGDSEEHACLLAGYFRTVGVQCYIVLGTSLMEAEAVWVLTNSSGSVRQGEDHKGERLDPSDLLLWDPITGRCYAVDDSACQLQAVGTVFDCNNIWANIQATGKPAEVKWDLSSAGLWKPFFGPDLAYRTMRTVQQEVRRSTHYRRDTKLGRAFYLGLAKHAEKCTMQSLEKMRARQSPYRSTPRAANFSDFLKRDLLDGEHLQELEAFLEAGGSVAQAALWHKLGDQFNRSLQGRLGTRNPLEDFQGHLFCLPMSDDFHVKVKRILKQTGLAKLPDNKWRFAVASSVHQKRVPFVCSIWVYVAAVRDKGS